ncbi:efflux RND transporter permease subunit [Leptospira paudalimensis]|uniref:Efflux RND transporter permease subunit n=1 Tax=Leptospira paudalimensis TaxID=2950024 RepID=A0ABT3M8S4_9LEPT|nr:efflux RND transporter permease subunit [Leptospira paudalimensis]MCW7504783.1 efflux RND transporter permease subunit [Leptospira paudalimensis]
MIQFFETHNRLCWVSMILMFIGIYFQMNRFRFQLLPNLTPLQYQITTSFANHSAEEVDQTLSLPMSKRISSLKAVKQIRTHSEHGLSKIKILLQSEVSVWEFKEELFQLLFEIKDELPLGVGTPKVQMGSENQNPFFEFTISKRTNLPKENFSFLINQLKYKLERISGVIEVKKIGDSESFGLIHLRDTLLNLHPVKIKDIELQIISAMQAGSLGKLFDVGRETEIKYGPEISSLEEIRKFPIHLGDSKYITLEEIAETSILQSSVNQIVQNGGNDSVYFAIYADRAQDPLKLSSQIQRILKEYKQSIQPIVYSDTSTELTKQLVQFFFFLLASLLCALIFSYSLYKEWFPVLCLLFSVIFSLVCFFHLMNLFAISVNLLSISGISVGIGMLFDSNNLIYYSIQSECKKGGVNVRTVTDGVRNVLISLFCSGLTTMVVIFPLLLYAHEWRDFFYDIGLSIVLLIFSSLVTSVTVVPLLFLTFNPTLRKKTDQKEKVLFHLSLDSNMIFHWKHCIVILCLTFLFLTFVLYPHQDQFHIFPKPKPIGKLIHVEPKYKIQFLEETFLMNEILNRSNGNQLSQNIVILPQNIHSDQMDPNINAVPFVIKYFDFDGSEQWLSETLQLINLNRWQVAVSELHSELSHSLPFLPVDKIVFLHENWEELNRFANQVLHLKTEEKLGGNFYFIPSPIKMKVWKSKIVPNSEVQPDIDDLEINLLYRNSPKFLGNLGKVYPLPMYLSIGKGGEESKNTPSSSLPVFKSAGKDPIFPESLFQMTEQNSYSVYQRESGKFYLEWGGEIGIETSILTNKIEGLQYYINSSKKETFDFYMTLFVLLICSYTLIYLALVGIYESFYRPFLYLSISFCYFLSVTVLLIITIPEIHFGHYMGLVILIGLSIDSISLYGERWELTREIPNISLRIKTVFDWLQKPILLNFGSTFFGLLPVVFIVFPGSEFVRAIAVTMCIGILVSYVFVFYLYPKIFKNFYDFPA